MEEKNNISDLFNANGCLNQTTIARFIDKELDDRELQKVISHLDVCPLCKDAAEGISVVGTKQFTADMNKLRTGFYAATTKKDKKNRLRLVTMISAAASIIIVLGVLYLYHRISLNADESIAQSVETTEVKKEKTAAGEETRPLSETTQPVETKVEKTRLQESEPEVTVPVMDMGEEAMPESEPVTDPLNIEMEYDEFIEAAKPATVEQPMELSEDLSVMPDMHSVAAASGQARSKSAVNTGFMKESGAQEAQSSLPAQQAITVSDKKPEFRGGDINDFIDYIQNQLNNSGLPQKRADADSVLISFVVDTLGRPVNIRLLNQIDPETEKQIIRQISSSPDWIPGTENGISIHVGYTISLRIPPERAD
jgi:protein TonB